MVKRFRKQPVVIEAVQFTGTNYEVIRDFCGDAFFSGGFEFEPETINLIKTLEGDMRVLEGDWIIKGIKGEFYPCKPDIFEGSYEEVV